MYWNAVNRRKEKLEKMGRKKNNINKYVQILAHSFTFFYKRYVYLCERVKIFHKKRISAYCLYFDFYRSKEYHNRFPY